MLSRPWPRRLTPDRARPWSGEPPPRCLTSCYNRLRQALRRPLESALPAAITVVDEAAAADGPARVQGLLQRVQHKAGVRRAGGTPADNTPREDVDDKGDIDKTGPCRDVGKIGHPQGVRTRRFELPIDAIERTRGRRIADRGPHLLAPHNALQAHPAHQARHGAAGHRNPFSEKLPPDLADAIDLEVLLVHPLNFGPQGDIAPGPGRQLSWIDAPGGVGVIRRRGDRQNAADRLDPVAGAGVVGKSDPGFKPRGGPPPAKKKGNPCRKFLSPARP